MSKHYISGSLFALALAAVVPLHAEAYFTTAQSASKISDSAALYTIEYAFGLEDYDIYMPIVAERNLAHESEEKKVGYFFTEDTGELKAEGTSAALVLSAAPIVNGMYKIEKGVAQKMTLLAVLAVDDSVEEEDFALQVQRLPYYVDKGGDELVALQLNPSELQYYKTEEIELNTRTE